MYIKLRIFFRYLVACIVQFAIINLNSVECLKNHFAGSSNDSQKQLMYIKFRINQFLISSLPGYAE